VVTAFIVTSPDVSGTESLADTLQTFVKTRLAAHLYPRRIMFVDSLPRTPSGKIQRKVLREQSRAEAMRA
jgi:acetyl-CoA synthetase